MAVKTQYESIQLDKGSSFHLMRNPNLSELFYWHFHPEFELVYIEGSDGTRHVGDHISAFRGSDLVLIGSYMPHLNFDYRIKTYYEKVVLHLHPDFWSQALGHFPELHQLKELFERAQYGIGFMGKTKEALGERLMALHTLEGFDQLLEVLSIFHSLALSPDYEYLHDRPYVNTESLREQERIRVVYRHLEAHFADKIALEDVATLCHLSKAAFCRYFKRVTGQTFTQFLNQYRISQAKRLLLMGNSVGEACFESGFESMSYFNRTFKKIAGENPKDFKRRHLRRKK